MFDHPVVDVALGLALLYSVLSLVASVVKEWISTLLSLRAKNLQKGIGTLIGDDSALKPALRALTNLGAETVDDLRRQVADWFDEGMNRVSGWYRRQTQLIIFAIGAIVAVTANASTVHVVQDLWRDDALRYAITQEAVAVASDTVSADSAQVADAILQSFPLGWEGEDPFGRQEGVQGWGAGTWIAHVFGWFFTAAAVSLGAPFWFDLLSKVTKLRGTGSRPSRG